MAEEEVVVEAEVVVAEAEAEAEVVVAEADCCHLGLPGK